MVVIWRDVDDVAHHRWVAAAGTGEEKRREKRAFLSSMPAYPPIEANASMSDHYQYQHQYRQYPCNCSIAASGSLPYTHNCVSSGPL